MFDFPAICKDPFNRHLLQVLGEVAFQVFHVVLPQELSERNGVLSENAFDDVAVDVCEATFEAVVVIGEAFVVEAEEVEDGGVEVVDGDGVFFGFGAKVVRGAVAVAFFDAGSGEETGEGVGVVVAAGAVAL